MALLLHEPLRRPFGQVLDRCRLVLVAVFELLACDSSFQENRLDWSTMLFLSDEPLNFNIRARHPYTEEMSSEELVLYVFVRV